MVRITAGEDGDRRYIQLAGHAGYGPAGRDIVCAAVSAVAYALMGWVANSPEYCRDTEMCDGDGYAAVAATGGERLAAAFDAAAIGLAQIARKYPENVRMDWRRAGSSV